MKRSRRSLLAAAGTLPILTSGCTRLKNTTYKDLTTVTINTGTLHKSTHSFNEGEIIRVQTSIDYDATIGYLFVHTETGTVLTPPKEELSKGRDEVVSRNDSPPMTVPESGEYTLLARYISSNTSNTPHTVTIQRDRVNELRDVPPANLMLDDLVRLFKQHIDAGWGSGPGLDRTTTTEQDWESWDLLREFNWYGAGASARILYGYHAGTELLLRNALATVEALFDESRKLLDPISRRIQLGALARNPVHRIARDDNYVDRVVKLAVPYIMTHFGYSYTWIEPLAEYLTNGLEDYDDESPLERHITVGNPISFSGTANRQVTFTLWYVVTADISDYGDLFPQNPVRVRQGFQLHADFNRFPRVPYTDQPQLIDSAIKTVPSLSAPYD